MACSPEFCISMCFFHPIALLILDLAGLIVGGLFFHSCPLQNFVPIFLVVSGVAGVAYGVFFISAYFFAFGSTSDKLCCGVKYIVIYVRVAWLFIILRVCFVIASSYFIFSIFNDALNRSNNLHSNVTASTSVTNIEFCDHRVYYTAFCCTILQCIILSLFTFVCALLSSLPFPW